MTGAHKQHRPETLRSEIATLGPWFHNLHLPGGIQTAPDHFLGDFPTFKWNAFEKLIPRDLTGQRILDIGCNAGFYSFALAERGAEVLGIDTDRHYLQQADWARRLLDAKRVTFERASVYDVDTLEGEFDVVVFMGVLYHLRHPLLALDLIAQLRPRLLIFQTLTFGDARVSPHARQGTDFDTRDLLADPGWPHLAFIEEGFCGDPTNWWVPNHAAAVGMLRSAGFTVQAQPEGEIYLCEFSGSGRGSGSHMELPKATGAVRRSGDYLDGKRP